MRRFVSFKLIPLQITSYLLIIFLISILALKKGYNYVPLISAILSLGYLCFVVLKKKKQWNLINAEKWLIGSITFYLFTFLIVLIIHSGKISQLDNPLKALLFVPILFSLSHFPIKWHMVIHSIPIGSLIAGCVAIYQRYYLHFRMAFEKQMHIQSGDIAMSLGIFSIVVAFYFAYKKQHKLVIFYSLCALLGIFASILSGARGGWIGVPFLLCFIVFIFRKTLSRKFFSYSAVILICSIITAFIIPNTQIKQRIEKAHMATIAYFEKNNGWTSVGARFDMWKATIIAAKEKPIFGWGEQGMIEKRKELEKQKQITKFAAKFSHAHNQYLDDLSKRGIVGLLGLLGIFFVPLTFFMRNMKSNNDEVKIVSLLGAVHVLSVMFYCLTQSFLAHNSGNIFYFFLVIVFYATVLSLKKQNENIDEQKAITQ